MSETILKYRNFHLTDGPSFSIPYNFQMKENDFSGPVLRVGVQSTHYTTDRKNYIPEYKDLLNQFPEWTTLSEGIVTVKVYEY